MYGPSGLYIAGLVQERRNPSALAMELRLPCINPSICWSKNITIKVTWSLVFFVIKNPQCYLAKQIGCMQIPTRLTSSYQITNYLCGYNYGSGTDYRIQRRYHGNRYKMAAVLQTTFSNSISHVKCVVLRFKSLWYIFIWLQLPMNNHWFR